MLLDDSHSRLLDDNNAVERNESRPRQRAVTWQRYSILMLGAFGLSILMNIILALQYYQLRSLAESYAASIYGC